MVKVPGWGYYFEAEIAASPEYVAIADKKIMDTCKELELEVLNDKDFVKLLESLNDRPGFRFNFKKEKFSEIKNRFKDYF